MSSHLLLRDRRHQHSALDTIDVAQEFEQRRQKKEKRKRCRNAKVRIRELAVVSFSWDFPNLAAAENFHGEAPLLVGPHSCVPEFHRCLVRSRLESWHSFAICRFEGLTPVSPNFGTPETATQPWQQ
ncbi:uncharacterized protein UTRI_03387 [Ustilago trichophora]|uniref:Uncharacterized protein n=1 Tax=Ustilago trichophora TaxID=86804 RepID=A0A5C3E3W2_9BASI|nr:uncharacterized protein UTRI_03387 [Ustilago trichophora]